MIFCFCAICDVKNEISGWNRLILSSLIISIFFLLPYSVAHRIACTLWTSLQHKLILFSNVIYVSEIGWTKMDPGLKENTIKLFVSFFWLTIEPARLRILAPAPYLQLLKKPHHLLSVLYQACWSGRLKGSKKSVSSEISPWCYAYTMQSRKRSSKILTMDLFTEIFESLVYYKIYASIWCFMVYNALKQIVSHQHLRRSELSIWVLINQIYYEIFAMPYFSESLFLILICLCRLDTD